MYSAELGRFMQRDPAGYVDGMNLYGYVKNNPLKYTDAWGLWSYDIHYKKTLVWLQSKKCGLSKEEAKIVAKSCNRIDSIWSGKSYLPILGDQRYHFNTNKLATSGSNSDNRMLMAMKHLRKAIILKEKSNRIKNSINENGGIINFFKEKEANLYYKKALKELGTGLHPLQDIDAHQDEYVRDGWLGYKYHDSPEFNIKPNIADNADAPESQYRVDATYNKTIQYLNQFKDEEVIKNKYKK